MSLVEAPCDLCGSHNCKELFAPTITTDELTADPLIYFSSSRQRAGYLRIVRCTQCGLVRASPRDDDATLQEVYSRLIDPIYESEDLNRRRTAQEHLRLIQRHTPARGSLLDGGCSTGIFLAEAAKQGWQVSGLEPSRWALERARARLPEAQLISGSLEQAALPGESFDAISLWDVMEHVTSPTETLRRIRGWLKPGGWVFMNVPNVASLTARLLGKRWVLLLREHLWYYSPKTMSGLLAKSGFKMVSARPNWVWFSMGNILSRVQQYPGSTQQAASRLAKITWLNQLPVKFPMGEMNVAARKG